jgi:hypothetical protein
MKVSRLVMRRHDSSVSCTMDITGLFACAQGLTLVHFSAQREHFLSHVVGCFAGFSDKNGSG